MGSWAGVRRSIPRNATQCATVRPSASCQPLAARAASTTRGSANDGRREPEMAESYTIEAWPQDPRRVARRRIAKRTPNTSLRSSTCGSEEAVPARSSDAWRGPHAGVTPKASRRNTDWKCLRFKAQSKIGRSRKILDRTKILHSRKILDRSNRGLRGSGQQPPAWMNHGKAALGNFLPIEATETPQAKEGQACPFLSECSTFAVALAGLQWDCTKPGPKLIS